MQQQESIIIEEYPVTIFGCEMLITIEAFGSFESVGLCESYNGGGVARLYEDYELSWVDVQSPEVGTMKFDAMPKELQDKIKRMLERERE
ncbi:MAG: hypothetical protein JKY52_00110 [Flavobacteriales bacterium]|nr:hypothetical protein [Flavobacteriales bacterium]